MSGCAGPLFDVVVVGAGPAGAAAAIALAAKGFSTAVISRAGRPGVVQGLSARAHASLRAAGLDSAAACASGPATRQVSWADERSERGQEALIERASFDVGLRNCLQERAVSCLDGSVQAVGFVEGTWQVQTTRGPLRGRTLLDARGRFARRSQERGPLLVSWSIVRHFKRETAPQSTVAALEDGWCWLAATHEGMLSAQFVGSATKRLSREQLAQRVWQAAGLLSGCARQFERLIEEGTYRACAAVARYSRPSRGEGYLRIGDAAVAMDPLSGNGIHEAVRSAHIAVAAINSYLLGESWPIVARFIDERSQELWRRSVSTAAGFYRLQADCSGTVFWSAAAAAYERAADRAMTRLSGEGRFELRPVLNGQRIELRRVWVSAAWPRGVWQVDGHSLEQIPVGEMASFLRRAVGAAPREV